jgi:hypothetical protein
LFSHFGGMCRKSVTEGDLGVKNDPCLSLPGSWMRKWPSTLKRMCYEQNSFSCSCGMAFAILDLCGARAPVLIFFRSLIFPVSWSWLRFRRMSCLSPGLEAVDINSG